MFFIFLEAGIFSGVANAMGAVSLRFQSGP